MRLDLEASIIVFGGRRFPVRRADLTDHEIPGLDKTMHRRQVILTFENGVSMSILWGDLTYSDNHDCWIDPTLPFIEEPNTVEIGFFDPKGDFMHEFGVIDYADDERALAAIDMVSALPSSIRAERTAEEVLRDIRQAFNDTKGINDEGR